MVVVAEPTLRPVQALVRWDPVGHAVRELAERAELGFPPVSRMAAVSGPPAAWPSSSRRSGCPRTPRCWDRCRCRHHRPADPRRPGAPPPGEHWEPGTRPGAAGQRSRPGHRPEDRPARPHGTGGRGGGTDPDRPTGHRLTARRWPAPHVAPRRAAPHDARAPLRHGAGRRAGRRPRPPVLGRRAGFAADAGRWAQHAYAAGSEGAGIRAGRCPAALRWGHRVCGRGGRGLRRGRVRGGGYSCGAGVPAARCGGATGVRAARGRWARHAYAAGSEGAGFVRAGVPAAGAAGPPVCGRCGEGGRGIRTRPGSTGGRHPRGPVSDGGCGDRVRRVRVGTASDGGGVPGGRACALSGWPGPCAHCPGGLGGPGSWHPGPGPGDTAASRRRTGKGAGRGEGGVSAVAWAGEGRRRASSRSVGLPAVEWVLGMERAAGTVGSPVVTLIVRVPDGSGVRSASAAAWAAARRAPLPAVHRLLGDPERRAHRVPREAERAVEVHGGRDQGFDTVPEFLGKADRRGGSASVRRRSPWTGRCGAGGRRCPTGR